MTAAPAAYPCPDWGFRLDRIPFTVYDFFAYLSSGAVLVGLLDYVAGLGLLAGDPTWLESLGLLLAAYLAGHVAAHFSSLCLESGLIARVLGRPAKHLMADSRSRWRRVFPLYFQPLPEKTRDRIRQRAADRGLAGEGEALFLHALSIMTHDDRVHARLDEFRNLYGLARNMAFVLLFAAALLALTSLFSGRPGVGWSAGAGFLGVTFLYRYLKFFRQYSYWLLLVYSERESVE